MRGESKQTGWSWAKLVFGLIFCLGIGSRFYQLDKIEDYYFDEVYHIPTAKLMAKGDPRAYQWDHGDLQESGDEEMKGTYIDWLHPPLAKLLQAASIKLFGDHAWAWRAPSALMGTLLIGVVYFLTRALWPHSPWAAVIAAGLATVDGLAWAQARIAMNDIFVTFFLTLGVYFYYRYLQSRTTHKWLLPLAIALGLAVACKWSGVFGLLFVGLWELGRVYLGKEKKLAQVMAMGLFLGSMTVLIYGLSYLQLFSQHSVKHFGLLHLQILAYQTNLDATHPFSSTAWEWPLGLKPVYLYYGEQDGTQLWNRPFYPSWYLALGCLILSLAAIFNYYFILRKPPRFSPLIKKLSQRISSGEKNKLLFLGGAYFCFWAPWIFSPRIMFFYHYLPAVPMLWVLAGGVLVKGAKRVQRVKD